MHAYDEGEYLVSVLGVEEAVERAETEWFEVTHRRGEEGYDETYEHHCYAVMCYCLGRRDEARK